MHLLIQICINWLAHVHTLTTFWPVHGSLLVALHQRKDDLFLQEAQVSLANQVGLDNQVIQDSQVSQVSQASLECQVSRVTQASQLAQGSQAVQVALASREVRHSQVGLSASAPLGNPRCSCQ